MTNHNSTLKVLIHYHARAHSGVPPTEHRVMERVLSTKIRFNATKNIHRRHLSITIMRAF